VNNLEAIFKSRVIRPFAIMSADPLQARFCTFWLKQRINMFSLFPLYDSYDGSLYFLHSILILINYKS